ncbi:hypothetical protein CGZ90_05350 [Fictibacillus aquaticus]|uniref:DUF4825 domain-containing protein n=2 Tax=Fictibacillus aquaticus TaxID=2021314 RepID=A0A235FEM7_9BACL|nr:hypothetical protein CGZ90_05350 [Fictibacillus aquaticus]
MILCVLILSFFLCGCTLSEPENKDLFQYKDSYIGDNSAIGNIVRQLANRKLLQGFELQTKEKPYGITLNYKYVEGVTMGDIVEETIILNSTFLFALVNNADWVTFHFGDETHTVKREKLEAWYGKKLNSFENEKELRKLVYDFFNDKKKMNEFFNTPSG